MALNNKTYDTLKWISTLVLPACGTLYFALAQIWALPYAEQIVGTITAVVTFLGAILKISCNNYKGDGNVVFGECDELLGQQIDVEIPDPVSDIEHRKDILLKIRQQKEI